MVSLLHVLQNLVVVRIIPSCRQFVITALCPYLCRCCYKHFHLGIREYCRTYVASIHYNALLFAQFALLFNHTLAYEIKCGNLTYVARDLYGPYLMLYIDAVEHSQGVLGFRVGGERDMYLVESFLEFNSIYGLAFNQPVLHTEICNGTIHCTTVEIEVTDVACKCFCHSALAA